ncbi:hypothetical protein VP01_4348g1 [Puccinia sorghi]|uniref:Uncharacterized protein n=1 Tax=Puccinia sorghi TaxID=27349 RepID=A0A0L6UPU5_9BASI|nr:hypothetical protein VP01_4348g1 [Puccinia sorghi]
MIWLGSYIKNKVVVTESNLVFPSRHLTCFDIKFGMVLEIIFIWQNSQRPVRKSSYQGQLELRFHFQTVGSITSLVSYHLQGPWGSENVSAISDCFWCLKKHRGAGMVDANINEAKSIRWRDILKVNVGISQFQKRNFPVNQEDLGLRNMHCKKSSLNCLQLKCSMLQSSCHPNSTFLTIKVGVTTEAARDDEGRLRKESPKYPKDGKGGILFNKEVEDETSDTSTHAKGLKCKRKECSETGLKCQPRGKAKYTMTKLSIREELNKENKGRGDQRQVKFQQKRRCLDRYVVTGVEEKKTSDGVPPAFRAVLITLADAIHFGPFEKICLMKNGFRNWVVLRRENTNNFPLGKEVWRLQPLITDKREQKEKNESRNFWEMKGKNIEKSQIGSIIKFRGALLDSRRRETEASFPTFSNIDNFCIDRSRSALLFVQTLALIRRGSGTSNAGVKYYTSVFF